MVSGLNRFPQIAPGLHPARPAPRQPQRKHFQCLTDGRVVEFQFATQGAVKKRHASLHVIFVVDPLAL